MALRDYIEDYASVRAALGVEDSELSDDTLDLPMYETQLGIALGQLSATLEADYLTIAEKADTTRSTAETLVFKRVQAFSVYAVAVACLPSLPMAAMKGEGDEKANYTRFSGDNIHQVVEDRITRALDSLSLGVQQAYTALQQAGAILTRTERVFAASAAPTYDPVTG